MRTSRRILCAAAVAVLMAAGPAGAATPGPGAPSIDQYIEAIPTSAGPQSVARGKERVQPLTREAEQQVNAEAGADAKALTEIATSSRYGAPVETEDKPTAAPAPPKPAERGTARPADRAEDVIALDSPAQAEAYDSRLIGLIFFMAASLAAATAYAGTRRSRERKRSAP
jgi:hypothetical protein